MRAISPAIASIFLIGVAVTGAITAGNAMFRQNEISMKTARLDILDSALMSIGTSKTYFAVTVKNTGTTTFSSIDLSFVDGEGIFHTISSTIPLPPGEQFGGYLVENVVVSSGKRYAVSIDGTTSGGSTFHSAETVVAR
jgi:hypothetical protein